ncbi:hypothetical protein So717_42320 [Roseobacter cerasinus]|uniref:Uncharacterized protein n=1 Tax=Roseobacter cerasinus TaxID=2602289 RepID=A0A640VWS8_9RHOB|nr:isopropylmalate isomerase [Roseobacter cerasinus]GFE52479.1 hypothetical protein So717_42320 [Roseobacter cerasinus]
MTVLSPDAVLSCAMDLWNPEIGDPSLMGWVTVGAYVLAGLLAGRVARTGAFPTLLARRERLFWGSLCLLMLLLAVNKQLDLQSFMTAVGRCVAKLEGWYEARRAVQQGFIIGFAVLTGGLGLWLVIRLRATLRRTGLALLGTILVFGFVLIRAVGFHHMEAIFPPHILSVWMNWALELSGLVLIILGAVLHRRKGQRRRRKQVQL